MASTTSVEGVRFLTQSPVRAHVLTLLYEEGPLRKAELRDRVDASRVTVRRNVDALEKRDWIETENDECVITALGDLVVEDVFPALEAMDVIERLRPFVRWFPEDDLEFDIRALADATVVVSGSSDPYAPVNRHFEAMQSADRFRCLLPAVGLQPMTIARECVLEDGCEHEVVVSEPVARTLEAEPGYREVIDGLVGSENCELRVATDDVGYYLGLCEECIQIGVEDDEGIPKALVETDAGEVRRWAERTYEGYRERADPFTP